MYRHLNIARNPDLINLDRFRLTTDPKKGATVFELTKQTGKFLATKTVRDKFGWLRAMKNFLGTVETPSALERSFKVATKLKRELPTDIGGGAGEGGGAGCPLIKG